MRAMSFLTRTKALEVPAHDGQGLKKTLGWPHLTALGVGAIIGTGGD
jgi:APA family basic amino acid/polyamine antiporter